MTARGVPPAPPACSYPPVPNFFIFFLGGGQGGVPSRSKFSGGGYPPGPNFLGGRGTLKVQIFRGVERGTLQVQIFGQRGGVGYPPGPNFRGVGRAGQGGVPSRSKFWGGGGGAGYPPGPNFQGGTPTRPLAPPVDRQSENITFVILRMAGGNQSQIGILSTRNLRNVPNDMKYSFFILLRVVSVTTQIVP